MQASEFLNYLLSREASRQLGLQLAEVYTHATRRAQLDVIGTR